MKRLLTFAMSLGLVAVIAVPVLAEVNAVTPSTNDQNRLDDNGHFDVVSVGVGFAEVRFVSNDSYWSCFEYRSDGDTSQKISDTNYNANITDGLYPYECVNASNSPVAMTIDANGYVEIRLVFGAETDERFDWTSVDVLARPDAGEKMDCMNGGWESYGFDTQGQCIRFLTSGKDSR